MLTLYRTSCSTDWKGRPIHELIIIGAAKTRQELLGFQDTDVLEWMEADIAIAKDAEIEDAAEEQREPVFQERWEIPGERWEMDMKDVKDWDGLRSFAEMLGDGGEWSRVYHILGE